MGTLTVSKLSDVSSYRGSSTALSANDVLELSLSGSTGYVSAKCTLANLKTYLNTVPANTTYKVFDLFYRTVNETPLQITYNNGAYGQSVNLYSAWPLFIDAYANTSDTSINKTAPNWVAKFNVVSPGLTIPAVYPTFWAKLQDVTSGIGGAFTSTSKLKWESVNINNSTQIAATTYMQEYNTYGYTGRFLIDTVNGLVAAPILNNTFVRNTSGNADFGNVQSDAMQIHNHYVLNWSGSGVDGPGNGVSDGYTLTTSANTGRTSDETRPKNVRYCPYMQIANTITDLSIINVNAALSGYNLPYATVTETSAAFSTVGPSATNVKAVTPYSLSGAFGINSNLSTNGYQKFPGGLILQWGTGAVATTETPQTITFPIPFTSVFKVVVSTRWPTGTNTCNAHFQTVSTTNTNFIVFSQNDGSSFGSGIYPDWIAIGI